MRKVILSFSILSTTIVILIQLALFGCSRSSDHSPEISGIDTLIKTEILSDRVMVIRLGWDAVTAVLTQKGIIIIDAGISNSITMQYRKIIEREYGRKDFVYLINTHSHPDHAGGNQVFSDAVIIGQENCIIEMDLYWQKKEEIKAGFFKTASDYDKQLKSLEQNSDDWKAANLQKIRYYSAYNDLSGDRIVTTPSLTFSDRMSLQMGDISFHLFYFGKAHTSSDILVYIPEEKLLFTGDLFSPGGKSWIGDAEKQDIERWNSVLKLIMNGENQINTVIGGHGEIMSVTDLESFRSFVEKRLKSGE